MPLDTTGRVLAVGAHPDDVEIMCSGTLFLLAGEGLEIHVATLTLGDCGTADRGPDEIRAIRRREAEEACAVLGAAYHALGFSDLMIYDTDEANRRVTALLREVGPRLVLTHSPQDYLADHETTSRLVRNACFYAPVPNYDTRAYSSAARSLAIPHLYYAHPMEGVDLFGDPIRPHLYVDIGSRVESKAEMLAKHASQREWLRAHHGIDEYVESMRRWGAELGEAASRAAGRPVASAEAFRQHRGHAYPREDALGALLGAAAIPAGGRGER